MFFSPLSALSNAQKPETRRAISKNLRPLLDAAALSMPGGSQQCQTPNRRVERVTTGVTGTTRWPPCAPINRYKREANRRSARHSRAVQRSMRPLNPVAPPVSPQSCDERVRLSLPMDSAHRKLPVLTRLRIGVEKECAGFHFHTTRQAAKKKTTNKQRPMGSITTSPRGGNESGIADHGNDRPRENAQTVRWFGDNTGTAHANAVTAVPR